MALVRLALQEVNVLVLDEPTNHLDIASQEVLEDVLANFDGTFFLVSHDRYLVQALATHVWAVGEGAVQVMEGGWEVYLQWRETRRGAEEMRKASRQDEREVQRETRRERKQLEKMASRQREVEEKGRETESKVDEAYQEHGLIRGSGADPDHFPLGSRVRVLPNHACMTAAAYASYHVVEGTSVVGMSMSQATSALVDLRSTPRRTALNVLPRE